MTESGYNCFWGDVCARVKLPNSRAIDGLSIDTKLDREQQLWKQDRYKSVQVLHVKFDNVAKDGRSVNFDDCLSIQLVGSLA